MAAKVRRDDVVMVMAGRDRGKRGKVLRVFPARGRAVVEGINLVKRHLRPTQDRPTGGFTSQEAPIAVANLARICPRCNRPVRVGFVRASDGTASRVCKRCGEAL